MGKRPSSARAETLIVSEGDGGKEAKAEREKSLTSLRERGAGANSFPPRLISDPPPMVLTVFHWLGNGALVLTAPNPPPALFPPAADGDPFADPGSAGGPMSPPSALTVVGPCAGEREGESMLMEISFPNARRVDPSAGVTVRLSSADSARTREKDGRAGGGDGLRSVLTDEDEDEEANDGGGGGGCEGAWKGCLADDPEEYAGETSMDTCADGWDGKG